MYDENGGLMAERCIHRADPSKPLGLLSAGTKMVVSGNYVNGEQEGEWVQTKKPPTGTAAHPENPYRNGDIAEIHDYSYTGKVSLTKILTDSTETRLYYQ